MFITLFSYFSTAAVDQKPSCDEHSCHPTTLLVWGKLINFTTNYGTSYKTLYSSGVSVPSFCHLLSFFFNNVSLVTGVYEVWSFIWQNKCENIQICQPNQGSSLNGIQGFVSHPPVIKKKCLNTSKHINPKPHQSHLDSRNHLYAEIQPELWKLRLENCTSLKIRGWIFAGKKKFW